MTLLLGAGMHFDEPAHNYSGDPVTADRLLSGSMVFADGVAKNANRQPRGVIEASC